MNKSIFKEIPKAIYSVDIAILDMNHATDIPVLAMLLELSARFLPIIIYCRHSNTSIWATFVSMFGQAGNCDASNGSLSS